MARVVWERRQAPKHIAMELIAALRSSIRKNTIYNEGIYLEVLT